MLKGGSEENKRRKEDGCRRGGGLAEGARRGLEDVGTVVISEQTTWGTEQHDDSECRI